MNQPLPKIPMPSFPTEVQQQAAGEVAATLAEASTSCSYELHVIDPLTGEKKAHLLPAGAVRALRSAVDALREGHDVVVLDVHAELGVQQLASLLGIPRVEVEPLLKRFNVPYRIKGKELRVLMSDFLAYKANHDPTPLRTLNQSIAREGFEVRATGAIY
jgi:hypothetical protein